MKTTRIAQLLLAGALLTLAGARGAVAAEPGVRKPPRGFKALFNGKDLTNWQGLVDVKYRATHTPEQVKAEQQRANETYLPHWTVKDGVLHYDGKGQSLQTAKDYGNFELWVDWKIEKGGDSGIYLRGNPQVQIWTGVGPGLRDGKFIGSGGLYNNKHHPSDPLVVADNPPGEWNTFYIKMIGDRVTVKLNDKLVVDNTPLENYWFPGQPLPTKGPIELQHHTTPLEFRNIFIKELPDNAAEAPAPAPKVAAAIGTITVEMSQIPFGEAVKLIASQGQVNVVMTDPTGTLAGRVIAFLSLHNKSAQKALEMTCRAAKAHVNSDRDGVFVIQAD